MSSTHSSKRKRDNDQATRGGNDSSSGNSAEGGCEEELHGEEVHSATTARATPVAFSLLDFADEIKFLIFSFSHGKGIDGRRSSSSVANLVNIFGFLSKDCYQCCIRYVQQNPMLADSLYGAYYLLHYPIIAFMCKHRVKLESMQLNLESWLHVGLSMHLLRSCDLTELRSITVVNSMRDRLHDVRDEEIAYVIASGIPREAIEEYHPISTSHAALQEIIADILVEQAPLLTEMKVTLFRLSDLSLLNRFSNQLEALTLTIQLSEEMDADAISQMIENMPKLKKLSFLYGWGSVRVRSQSLEEIDGRTFDGYVTECICPSLKMFYCCLGKGVQSITVDPVTPFTREDLKTEQDFKVGDRPFIGMTVPNACIVRLSF